MSLEEASISERSTEPVYILDLTVSNVRCFGAEPQTLKLTDAAGRPAPWTVILGDNGVGKTTLLQCLAALEPRRHYFKNKPQPGKLVLWDERLQVELPTEEGMGWQIYRDYEWPQATSISGHASAGHSFGAPGPIRAVEIIVPTSTGVRPATGLERLGGLLCCGYGATRRMGVSFLTRSRYQDPVASLFGDYVSLIDAQEWLVVEDYASLASEPKSDEEPVGRRLDRVKRVLIDLLPDAEDLRIDFRGSMVSATRPSIEIKTPYGWVSLGELSLGYRTMIAWAVDLASQLFAAYPDSPNPLAEPAIVLVDEVDLHLHPKWQRQLRAHLQSRFPATQFIVTAHSPLVVQASEDENIVVLRREGDHVVIDNDVETVRGWRVDQVLTSDLFGLETGRPPAYDHLITERNEILARESLSARERGKLERLEEQILALPSGESPDDLRAMDVIRRAAAKLANS